MSRKKTYAYEELDWLAAERALETARKSGYGYEPDEEEVRDIVVGTIMAAGFSVRSEKDVDWSIDFNRPGDSHVGFSGFVPDMPKFFNLHASLSQKPETVFEKPINASDILHVSVNAESGGDPDVSIGLTFDEDELTDEEAEDLERVKSEISHIAGTAAHDALWAVVKQYEAENSDETVVNRLEEQRARFTREGEFA